ncbi:MAG TPA: PEGA domain-containing protein [Candidatus Acidoferrales bacterium]|nr:PEGA domain-containing protein [Candidatus Acidoferrales bacterium]
MRIFQQALALVLVCALLIYGQGNTFDKIRYNGGTVATTVSPKDWDNRLTVTADLIRLELKDGQAIEIDPEAVSGLSYGQEAHRRVGTMVALGILVAPLALFGLFHKTRLHFVGIEYTTAEGKPAGLLMQAHKNNYRAALMALRGATGAPIAVAEEDRKYVPTGVEAVVVKSEEEQAEEIKKAAKQEEAQTGVVAVNSTPDAAEIWVDGAFVGNTPAKLTLPAGKHNIRVSLQGHADWVRDVQVLPNSDVTLNAALVQP